MFLIRLIRSIHAGAINNILAEAVKKTTCVRVYVCVWVCLCVRLSEHVQTPMLKRLRARETTAVAQFAGFFSQFFLLSARPP